MFAKKIKELRTKAGLSQQALADLCGVTQGSVSHWEKGRAFPEIKVAHKLCSIFNISLADIMDGDDHNLQSAPAAYIIDSSDSMRNSGNAQQDMVSVLEQAIKHYLPTSVRESRIAEAAEILQSMTDEEYKMALNVLRAMKK